MKAIVAMDLNRTIGNNGKLPWPKIAEDMAFFKEMTVFGNLIMGRKTFESVGTLPLRYTYVLSREHENKQLICNTAAYINIDEVKNIENYKYHPDYSVETWVCGGAEIYKQLLPHCTDVYVTHVLGEYEGDAFMPEFENEFPVQMIMEEAKDFWIVRYSKPSTCFASCSG